MGGLQGIVISITLIALFSLAILSYAFQYATDNNAVINLANDTDFSTFNKSIKGNLSSFRTLANESSIASSEGSFNVGDEQPSESGNQFKITLPALYLMVKSVINIGFKKIFGNDSNFGIILSAFLAVLTIIIGYATWKLFKGGNPN